MPSKKTKAIPPSKLADKLAKHKSELDDAPHLIVQALAGTGKSTTIIEGIKLLFDMPPSIIPSPQQQEIWDSILLSKGKAKSVCFCAFNKSIATELQQRVPPGCIAQTMHSMGFKAVQAAFGKVQVNQYRVQDIISELLGKDIRDLRKDKFTMIKAVEELVGLCKQTLTGFERPKTGIERLDYANYNCQIVWPETLANLADYYDVDCNGSSAEIFDLVPQVLERCKDVAKDRCIDFADMVWLPVVLNLSVQQYDLLLVDEVQDLAKVQQQLALKAGKRLILVGDSRQAIYGWVGADSGSMERMYDILLDYCRACDGAGTILGAVCEQCAGKGSEGRGCRVLPLTVTRRCGRAIVEEAKKIVPNFEWHPNNGEGKVSYARMN